MRHLLLFILTLVLTSNVAACECDERLEIKEEFNRSDIVVSGRVIEILDFRENINERQPFRSVGRKVKLEVLMTFKGNSEIKYFIVRGSGSCDFRFRKGKEYLVFGWTSEGELVTSTCTRTGKLRKNSDVNDLKEFKTTHNNR